MSCGNKDVKRTGRLGAQVSRVGGMNEINYSIKQLSNGVLLKYDEVVLFGEHGNMPHLVMEKQTYFANIWDCVQFLTLELDRAAKSDLNFLSTVYW